MIVDVNNVIPRIGKELSPVELDIGCGPRKRDAACIGIDVLLSPGVDIVGDVHEVLTLLPDDSVDSIYSSHFMEHLHDMGALFKELERVLKPGGQLRIIVPHFSNPYFYSDPTHKTFFGLYTFCYLAECNLFSRKVPNYGHTPVFVLQNVKLVFKSSPPFYMRYGVKRIVQWLVNICAYNQEFYEDMLTGLISCYEIDFLLVKK
jgi:ubiquinone/menaquinone biosynthesis C-methylase UbiE